MMANPGIADLVPDECRRVRVVIVTSNAWTKPPFYDTKPGERVLSAQCVWDDNVELRLVVEGPIPKKDP